jgi:AraC-like DNA-binding protein
MLYNEFRPPASLSQIVRYFWIIDHHDECDTAGKYRLLAESSPSLVFFPHVGQCVLAGHTFRAQEFSITGKFLMIGACLYPYSIPMLYKVPAYEFSNRYVSFNDLEYFVAPVMLEKMRAVACHQKKLKILSDYLFSKAKDSQIAKRSLNGCVQSMVHAGGQLSIDHIVTQLGTSSRQAERNFKQNVGCSPKQFSRLLRFHASLKCATPFKKVSLTDVAYVSGYADQSHFIRDFKEFSGMSPKEYFKLESLYRADNFVMLK